MVNLMSFANHFGEAWLPMSLSKNNSLQELSSE